MKMELLGAKIHEHIPMDGHGRHFQIGGIEAIHGLRNKK